jgi:Mn2+/Fe2+ NRAMP family transporter
MIEKKLNTRNNHQTVSTSGRKHTIDHDAADRKCVGTDCGHKRRTICDLLKLIGPGLIVMLADTDAGSIVTAAQSGAVWGYKLLIVQIVLIPVLYLIQEMTIRAGISTGKGHIELIKKHFGNFWAWTTALLLFICCIGALITELSGIVSVGNLFGMAPKLSMCITIFFLTVLVVSKNYRSVECIALICGLFELVYVFVAWKAHPGFTEIVANFSNLPITNHSYLYLAAANIGAVIMPWMIFYQQSAITEKKLTICDLKVSRLETLGGAFITQIIMSAILIAVAATIGKNNPGVALESIEQISQAITPYLGDNIGHILFSLGMLGASLIATIVVLLTATWSIGEITGHHHALQNSKRYSLHFYVVYFITLLICAAVVTSDIRLVNLNVAVETMNALVLPLVIGFLFILAYKKLPDSFRLKGWYAFLVGTVVIATTLFGLVAGTLGIIHIV